MLEHYSFIDVEELMSVMVMLSNPRTEEEVRNSQSEALKLSHPIRSLTINWPMTGEDHDPGGGQERRWAH